MDAMPASPVRRSGRVITFYSFKGGVGRSMALANIAVLLAQMQRRVLLVDWDLEAPGLHRYFEARGEAPASLLFTPAPTPDGLISSLEQARLVEGFGWKERVATVSVPNGERLGSV